jgi:hypothetical protein
MMTRPYSPVSALFDVEFNLIKVIYIFMTSKIIFSAYQKYFYIVSLDKERHQLRNKEP